MIIDEKNIENTLILLDNYFNKENIDKIATITYPKAIEPNSKEWLIYMFYSCLLDYGVRSKIYHHNLINTYEKHKEIFNPKYILENNKYLLDIIKNNIHHRYPNIALNKWIKLSEELNKYDILEKIKEFKSFSELEKFIKSINGFGQKTGGLLLRTIYESNIINLNDDIKSIPLDRHDIEISYLNGIINQKKLNEKEIKELSDSFVKIGNKLSIKPNIVDRYLWEIGNRFCNKKDCQSCPLVDCDNKWNER